MNELNAKLLEFNRVANIQANYEKTLMLLAALKSGEVTVSDFELIPGGWNLIQPKPAELAAIDSQLVEAAEAYDEADH